MNYDEIYKSLLQKDLQSTFPAIREKARILANWEIAEDIETLWMTYQQMILFLLNGAKDPKAESIRDSICLKLITAVTKMERYERLMTHREHKYVSSRKSVQNTPSFESIVNNLEQVSAEIIATNNDELLRDSVRQYNLDRLEGDHELALVRLFYWVWTSEPWTNNDVNQANKLLFSDNISSSDKAVLISALTLSVMEYPDKAKELFLLDCYLYDDILIAQRALVGFVFTYYINYDNCFAHSKELTERLEIYKEDPVFVSDFYSVITQLQFSATTDKVTDKMRTDILPALMQGRFMKPNKTTSVDINEMTKHGENPEWLDNEAMNKKVREISELQLSGADVYYSSFASLKGYPFFSEMAHWFYPFSTDNSLVQDIKKIFTSKIGRVVKLMLKGSPFCDSDKYSLCFTFNSIGSFGEAMIEEQVQQQLSGTEQLDELVEEAEKTVLKKADIRRHYVFDLYRFYYSYPYKSQFRNPFELLKKAPITPFSNKMFTALLANDYDSMAQYAEFLMRKEFYESANIIYEKLANNEFDNELASVWQKYGFCQQKLGHNPEAMHAYEVANSLKPNSKWTLSHLASMAVNENKPKSAVKYYKALLDIDPENIKYLLSITRALVELGRYEEALPLLHKANFIDDNNDSVKQDLAWCLILHKDNGKAMKHILSMLSADANDKRAKTLYSLVMLTDGNPREALNSIKDYIDDETLRSDYHSKLRALSENGLIDKATLQLFFDALVLNIN